MNNLKKLGLTALAGSLALTTANATEYSVTGDAILKYASIDDPKGNEAASGKGIGVDTDLYFNASGETDNGWTVAFFQAANTDGAWSNSSSQVTIGMGGLGTLKVNNKFGAAGNGIDDVMPAAYNETWDGMALTTDNPSFFGSSTASGSVDYRIPAMEMMGATINASYTYDGGADVGPAAAGGVTTTSVSGSAVTLEIAHESGLSIGGGQETIDNGGTAGGDEENVTVYAKFAMGPLTVGVQSSESDEAGGATNDTESTGFGLSYQVNDDLAVSVGSHEIEYNSGDDQESFGVSASYTMGSLAIKAAMNNVDNIANTATNDRDAYELGLTFAF